ncbi:MAG TPA: sensor histidine kinase [Xanthobacteraceae bacterium]|jgi:two-component sensor histidine kinase|nr:sensor histidine kinase [Xanthobacteraceae bacterium]
MRSVDIEEPGQRFSEGGLLLHELSHRINNEFASIIGTLSLASARTKSDETKAALTLVQDQLHSYAQVHHVLQMPEHNVRIDAAAYLRKLCKAIGRSTLDARQIELVFVDRPFQMESTRCWRLGLIVSELITNAARHAFKHSGGVIRVEIVPLSSYIKCRVVDNGNADAVARPGRGLRIIHALTDSLGGTFDQHFGLQGTTATLTFPSGL